MAAPLFDLYFSGKIVAGEDVDQVRNRLGKLFSADQETLERLFSGDAVRIKTGVDQESAIRYRVALRDAGALLEIRPQRGGVTKKGVENRVNTPQSDAESLSLLPANTGSLEEFSPEIEAAKIPDITNIQLAPEGSNIDRSEPVPVAPITATGLTMAEPNSGTLEDCQEEPTPLPIPDISHLKITNS